MYNSLLSIKWTGTRQLEMNKNRKLEEQQCFSHGCLHVDCASSLCSSTTEAAQEVWRLKITLKLQTWVPVFLCYSSDGVTACPRCHPAWTLWSTFGLFKQRSPIQAFPQIWFIFFFFVFILLLMKVAPLPLIDPDVAHRRRNWRYQGWFSFVQMNPFRDDLSFMIYNLRL